MTATTTTAGGPGALDARQRWFGLDAVATGANALGYLALASWLSEHLGASASAHRTVGAGLLLFAAAVTAYAVSTAPPRWAGAVIVRGNVAWIACSVVVAGAGIGDLTGLGRAWALAQALVVAALTALQASSIRRR